MRRGPTDESTDGDTRAISLPEDVVSSVEDRLQHTEFDVPSEYIAFVLETVLRDSEHKTEANGSDGVTDAEVKHRLRRLGYLDD